ncbi:hypothetical protein [Spirosoma sordidisoli]|uniref:Uncharacterized protein n=1 Tax=Spirosoma sordidisoli TaxID=2502893 RepID=A0A4Q2UBT9_9BACT|nr:hypothetical protein [Spirosoma sordidisoli]RYC66234.1 hypothetical protein EQG79_30650 [Spirosoma sordidisoli]
MKTPTGRNNGLLWLLALLLLAGRSPAQSLQIRVGVQSVFAPNGPLPSFGGAQPGQLLPQVQFSPTPGYGISIARPLQIGAIQVQPEVNVSLYRIGYNLIWTRADRTVYGTQTNVNTTPAVTFLLPFREQLTKGKNVVSLLLGPYVQVRGSHYTEMSQGSPNTVFPAYERERYGIEDKYRSSFGIATGVQLNRQRFDVRLLAQFGKTALFSSTWQKYNSCLISLSAGYAIGAR